MFLDTFSNFELQQLILEPTHKFGNIIDILLTDKSYFIVDIKVSDSFLSCKSGVKSKFKRLKIPKREVYNDKHADWAAINNGLNTLDCATELNNTDMHAFPGSVLEISYLILLISIFPKLKFEGLPNTFGLMLKLIIYVARNSVCMKSIR